MRFLFLLFIGLICLAGCGNNGRGPTGGSEAPASQTGPAEATAVETRTAPAAGELAYIEKFVGKRPAEVGLWQTEPLQARLRRLIGSDYELFVDIMQEAGPLTRDGVIYTFGVAPDDAVPGVGYLLVDIENDKLRAFAVFGDLQLDVQSPGGNLTPPTAVTERVAKMLGE